MIAILDLSNALGTVQDRS